MPRHVTGLVLVGTLATVALVGCTSNEQVNPTPHQQITVTEYVPTTSANVPYPVESPDNGPQTSQEASGSVISSEAVPSTTSQIGKSVLSSVKTASTAAPETASKSLTTSSALPPTSELTSKATETSCKAPYVPTFPGSRLKASNAADVQGQLDTLALAMSSSGKVGSLDILHAEAIGVNSLADPAYAKALTVASSRPDSMPNAEQLIAMGFSGPKCIGAEQIQQTSDLYDILIDGLAPRAGKQISFTAKKVYASLKAAAQAFKTKYQNY